MIEILFSYGTLQLEQVQIDTFNRKLKGVPDRLYGYSLEKIEITDQEVLNSSKEKFHPVALPSNNADDFIDGVAFELSQSELEHADRYEVDDYIRVSELLESGKSAWVYISSQEN